MATRRQIFTPNGTVQAGNGLYIPRQADDDLFDLCSGGTYTYILTARQMGKSSLMVNVARRLEREGVATVQIDLSAIGTHVTPDQWYQSILQNHIARQLQLGVDTAAWLQTRQALPVTSRFDEFLVSEVVEKLAKPVVVFIDEIDTSLGLTFADDFFAAVRALYNRRANEPALRRLTFVLIGVATPDELARDTRRTPFNIGERVELTDFTFDQIRPLHEGFDLPEAEALALLEKIHRWTGGHPYLTQRLCFNAARRTHAAWTDADVEALVTETFLTEETMERDANLQFVRDMLTKRAPNQDEVLAVYRAIRAGTQPVPDDPRSPIVSHLKLSGLVRPERGLLIVRNPIYRQVFNTRWIDEHLPSYDRHVAQNWTSDDLNMADVSKFLEMPRTRRMLTPHERRVRMGREQRLRTLKLLSDAGLPVGAVLCFANRDMLIEQYGDVVRLELAKHIEAPDSTLKTVPVQKESVQDNLLSLLESGMGQILTNFGPFDLPERALYEALANALMHRDYALQGPVQINLYPTHIDLISPGGLPDGVVLQTLNREPHQVQRIWRNPIIADIIASATQREDSERPGIARMIDSLMQVYLPRPEFSEETTRDTRQVRVRFTLPTPTAGLASRRAGIGLAYNAADTEQVNQQILTILSSWNMAVEQRSNTTERALIALLSPESVDDIELRHLCYQALARNIPVIPVMLRECAVPRLFDRLGVINFQTDIAARESRLYERLASLESEYPVYLRRLAEIWESEGQSTRHFENRLNNLRRAIENLERVQVQAPLVQRNAQRNIEQAESHDQTEIDELVRAESGRMQHYYIGVEHYFVTLSKLEGGIVADVLTQFGHDPAYVAYLIREIAGPGEPRRYWPGYIITPRMEKIAAQANSLQEEGIRPAEKALLLAILDEGESVPARVLHTLGVDLKAMRRAAAEWFGVTRQVAPLLRIQSQTPLEPEQTQVLQDMFRRYASVEVLEVLPSGMGPATVMLVRPMHADGMADAPIVVKVNERQAVLVEKRRYDTGLRDRLPPQSPRLEATPTLSNQNDQGGLRYSFVQRDSSALPMTFGQFAQTQPPTRVAEVLRAGLYDTFKANWWQQGRPYSFAVWQEYDLLLPPTLVIEALPQTEEVDSLRPLRPLNDLFYPATPGEIVRPERFVITRVGRDVLHLRAGGDPEAVNRAHLIEVRGVGQLGRPFAPGEVPSHLVGRVVTTRQQALTEVVRTLEPNFDISEPRLALGFGLSMVNPLSELSSLLKMRVTGSVATIHGALRQENMLVSSEGEVLLIDFENAREGHALFDWATLEVSLLMDVISLSLASGWGNLLPLVLGWSALEASSALPDEDSLLPVREVRRIVSELLNSPGDWAEYHAALAICALGAMAGLKRPQAARRLAFLVSAIAMELYNRSGRSDRDVDAMEQTRA